MENKQLVDQLTTHLNQIVKLREFIDAEIVRQVRFPTAERSGASLLLMSCDYFVENLSALKALLALK